MFRPTAGGAKWGGWGSGGPSGCLSFLFCSWLFIFIFCDAQSPVLLPFVTYVACKLCRFLRDSFLCFSSISARVDPSAKKPLTWDIYHTPPPMTAEIPALNPDETLADLISWRFAEVFTHVIHPPSTEVRWPLTRCLWHECN